MSPAASSVAGAELERTAPSVSSETLQRPCSAVFLPSSIEAVEAVSRATSSAAEHTAHGASGSAKPGGASQHLLAFYPVLKLVLLLERWCRRQRAPSRERSCSSTPRAGARDLVSAKGGA